MLSQVAILATIALSSGLSRADAAEPLRVQIDRLISFQTPGYEALAAPVALDDEFMRRVTLDLIGTIPSAADARAFFADADPAKRERLVDRLLATPEYARHMQRTFDVLLMRRLPQKNVPLAEWEKFLRESFAQNKPWDQIVREILTADGSDPAQRGPARFYLDRDGDVNQITRDIGKLFLGVNLECAQCHNHPNIDDYLQSHFYGISAFFVRSFVMTDKEKLVVFAEKADGEATFESVFEIRDKVSKGPRSSGMKLFEGLTISEPKFDKVDDAYAVKPDDKDKTLRPVPRFSRRVKFAEWVASSDNRRFCRTTANRLWALLLGRGIVHPVDLDHTGNPPSHPLLLALLTEELAARQMDLKSVIREIVLSQTYQRASRRNALAGAPEPRDDQFAVAPLKSLTPAQFAWSVMQATGETEAHRIALGEKFSEETLFTTLQGYEQRFTQLFGGEPGRPAESFESTADQVLFLANDPAMMNFLLRKNGNLCDRLLKLPEENPPAIADELYLSTLTRLPTAEDVQDVQNYLAGQTGDPRTACMQELIWAIVTSSEFRFNH
ncbi:MAG: DUF1549 domain-containing protein [Planctomycetaceae bacterium]|nr:DUF1549 domain-containing protein [Planctomycetaceae bacterium]